MNRALWWSKNQYWCAPVVALGSGVLAWALVWSWTHRFASTLPVQVQNQSPSNGTVPLAAETLFPATTNQDEEGSTPIPALVAEVLRRAPIDATTEERALVWNFLSTADGWTPELEALWLRGADEALTWLRGAEQAHAEVEAGLVGLVQNPKLPEALREFVLQHLGIWAEDHEAGEAVLRVFQELVMSESTTPMSGRALEALCRTRFAQREVLWIRKAALALATNSNAHRLTRLAALEAAGQLGFEEIEPPARELLARAETIHERVTALHVLGWVGGRGTLEWLERRPAPSETLAAAAHSQALHSMRERWAVVPAAAVERPSTEQRSSN